MGRTEFRIGVVAPGSRIEPDFDHAVRRHRMLDAIVRASQTGQRQTIAL